MFRRFKTREVLVGKVGVGGDNPIRIQSMTTSSTRDVFATVEQIKKLSDFGCEIARITVQGMKEAFACEEIKSSLISQGYEIPLVADIHFYPPAAMQVVEFVDKVRINPGNFVDPRATFKTLSYNNDSYQAEIQKIREKFSPLVEKCKTLKRAMRIGTNHGSLSDRIMNRYGDTPLGMVESALEFARICRELDYHDFVFSMKASNPLVMMQTYRLLHEKMLEMGWDYPMHLGVTEAGNKEDGRIKSAIGIGTILMQGLGDTIRVSLTEDPWFEIDPCKRLVSYADQFLKASEKPFSFTSTEAYKKREVLYQDSTFLHKDGSVLLSVTNEEIVSGSFFKDIGIYRQLGKYLLQDDAVDGLILEEDPSEEALQKLLLIEGKVAFLSRKPNDKLKIVPIVSLEKAPLQTGSFVLEMQVEDPAYVKDLSPLCIILKTSNVKLSETKRFFANLNKAIPVVLSLNYDCSYEDVVIQSSCEIGALLTSRCGEGVHLSATLPLQDRKTLSFGILQGCRMRSSKTEYIACPGCGRTLFGLQEVTEKIKEKTAHLPGVKIAVMGCIVNGPGEMADADFGYVGSRPGKIDLYVGKTCVEKNIDDADACDKLVSLIKQHGKWKEKVEIFS